MSHSTKQLICKSLLHHFDPDSTVYPGSREHFTARQLAILDDMRSREYTEDAKFNIKERCLLGWAILHLLTVKTTGEYDHED